MPRRTERIATMTKRADIQTARAQRPVPATDDRYKVGTLHYTRAGLVSLFGWMIMGNLCFNLFEGNGGAGSIPFYLQDNFHISNTMVSVLFNFIPMIIGTFMTPIVSFWSDRARTRLGRRIPYILFTAPFLVLFAIGLGFSDDIIAVCKIKFAVSSSLAPMSAALGIIGFMTIGWAFFNEFVGTVYYYLIPDVMPRHFLGRFQGATNVAGQVLNIFMNSFVNAHQLTHIKAIHVGVAVLYFVGFGLVCWRVKEGKYPPVEDVTEKTTFLDKTKLYFKECFNHPMYILIYMVTAVTVLTRGLNPSGMFALHMSQHQGQIAASAAAASVVAITPDGKCFVSGGRDGQIRIWDNADLKKPRLIRSISTPAGSFLALQLSGDGQTLVSAGASNGNIEVWNAAQGAHLRTLSGHDGAVRSLALFADGKRLASGGDDRTVRLWDLPTGTCLQTLTGHEDRVNSVAFSSTGTRIVSGSSDRRIIVWDAQTGAHVKTIEGSPGPVYAVCFAPALGPVPQDGTDTTNANVQGTAKTAGRKDAAITLSALRHATLGSALGFLKNVFVNESLYAVPPDKTSRILGEDRWVVSGGRDGETDEVNSGVRIWDIEQGTLIPAVEDLKRHALKGHKKAITSVCYKPDLRVILSGSLDDSIRMWKPTDLTSEITRQADDQSFKSFSGYTRGVTSVAIQNAGVRMVNASEDGALHTWNIDEGISLEKGSLYKGNFFALLVLLLSYPIGALVDRWNPIKIVLWTTFLGLPSTLIYFFFFHNYVSSFWIDLVMQPINLLAGMASLPMMVMLYPKTKYGQFSSANAMIKQFVGAIAGILGALLMDQLTVGSFDTDNYRYGYLFKFGANFVSFLFLLGVFLYWKKMGGEKDYVAPEADGRHLQRKPDAVSAART